LSGVHSSLCDEILNQRDDWLARLDSPRGGSYVNILLFEEGLK